MRTAELDGVRLVYDVRGADDAPTMLLLHALGDRRGDWATVAERFAHDHRVVVPDLRGHGDSDWPGEYSFALMADDVVRLLDHLGLDRVVLVAHSMGGGVAWLVAEQQPDRVERLVVEDAPPPFVRDRPLPQRPAGDLPFDWAVVPAIAGEVGRGNPTTWERLSTITAPTLLVGGGPDSHVPQELLAEVAERVPDCVLVTVPAGHDVHAARPAEFADLVLSWLASRRD